MDRSVTYSEAQVLNGKVLVSVEEAAEMLSLGRTLVYDLIMRRQLASIKIGRTRRVPVSAIREFVERQLARTVE